MITSIYLANNTIRAVVGTKGRNIRVKKVCRAQIPDGSLINGIITNEAELAAQLKEFWEENRLPRKNVELVINSSQFVLKSLTLSKLGEKKLREQLPLEFSDVSGTTDGVIDYMEESEAKKQLTIQAVMAERSFIQNYISLFDSIGVKVSGISPARVDLSKALMSLRQLKDKTAIVMFIDGSTINSNLWSGGASVYATQKRVFSEPGTAQFVTEIARVISSIQQFASTQHLENEIREVFLSGIDSEDYEMYRQGIDEMALGVTVGSLEREKHIRLAKNVSCHFSEILPELGNLRKEKKDINMVASAKRKVKKKSADSGAWKKQVVLPAILLVIALAATGALYGRLRARQKELNGIEEYLENPQNLLLCTQADALTLENSILSRRVYSIERMNQTIASYPYMNSNVVAQLQTFAGAKAVELEVRSYSADNGTLNLDAKAEQVVLINQFIDDLEKSGIFDDIQYTGYTYSEEKLLYTINVTCYLSESAGK